MLPKDWKINTIKIGIEYTYIDQRLAFAMPIQRLLMYVRTMIG